MREKNQETQADIIAEMRMGKPVGPCAYRIGLPDKEVVYESGAKRLFTMIKDVTVQELADRLEAAAKREKAQHGNVAAMREALKPWIAFGEWLLGNAGKDRLGEAIRENGPIIRQRLEELRDALAAPPRNCDMGTEKEQSERFRNFCKIESSASGGRCTGCRAICYGRDKCEFSWAQMPYAAKEGETDGV